MALIVKVAGVTFENRQKQIKRLASENSVLVKLVREPKNPVDPYAVKVIAGGYHIGYIPKKLARRISESWDQYKYISFMHEILEGNDNPDHRRSWGVRIALYRMKI